MRSFSVSQMWTVFIWVPTTHASWLSILHCVPRPSGYAGVWVKISIGLVWTPWSVWAMGELMDDRAFMSWDLNMRVRVKWHSEDDEMSHCNSLTISLTLIFEMWYSRYWILLLTVGWKYMAVCSVVQRPWLSSKKGSDDDSHSFSCLASPVCLAFLCRQHPPQHTDTHTHTP